MLNNIVDENLLVKNRSIEEVYYHCLEWFDDIEARIEEKRVPEYIRAFHYKLADPRWGWIHGKYINIIRSPSLRIVNFEKIIEIQLKKNNNDIWVHITMNPINKILGLNSYKNRSKHWLKFVGDLGQFIEAEMTPVQLQHYYNVSYFNGLRKEQRIQMLLSIMFTIIISIWSLYFIPNVLIYQIIAILIFIYSCIVIIFEWYNIKNIELRYKEIHLDI